MKRFGSVSRFVFPAAVFLLFLSVALMPYAGRIEAQSTFGSLRGLTVDATGSAVPAAEITLHGLDDNSDHQTTSGDDGVFEIENLKPGHYRVTGHKPGFADALVPQLALEARQELRVTLTFAVASQSQTVEVSAVAEQMNTENGTIAGSLESLQLTQLPLNSRAVSTSPLAALQLSPEVQYDAQGNISIGGATSAMVGYSVMEFRRRTCGRTARCRMLILRRRGLKNSR